MMEKFVARERELKNLEEMYDSSKFEMAVICHVNILF